MNRHASPLAIAPALALALVGVTGCTDSPPLTTDAEAPDVEAIDAAVDAWVDRGGPLAVPDSGPAPMDAAPDAVDLAPGDGGVDGAPDGSADAGPPPGPCVYPVHDLPPGGGVLRFDEPAGGFRISPHLCRLGFGQTHVGRVVRFTLDRPATVGVHAPGGAYAFVRSACVNAEVACGPSVPWRFELEAGTWFVTVLGDPLQIELELDPPLFSVACDNGVDDDGDGWIDLDDPGCSSPGDAFETDREAAPACADGLDNDDDAEIDWPADRACSGAGDPAEAACGPPGTVSVADDEPVLVDTLIELALHPGGCGAGEAYVVHRVVDRVGWLTPRGYSPIALEPHGLVLPRAAVYRGCAIVPEAYVGCVGAWEPGVLVEPGPYLLVYLSGPDLGPPLSTSPVLTSGPCANGLDDDHDGLTDLDDPGCVGVADAQEGDPIRPPACANGLDDDGDGAVDWPEDVHCTGAGAEGEAGDCVDRRAILDVRGGVVQWQAAVADDVGGGCAAEPTRGIRFAVDLDREARIRIPHARLGPRVARLRIGAACDGPEGEVCLEAGESSGWLPPGRWYGSILVTGGVDGSTVVEIEVVVRPACDDGVDGDGDGRIDLDDAGCRDRYDDDEADPPTVPGCADGLDGDGDGRVDYPDDPDCLARGDETERALCRALPVVEQVGPPVIDPIYVPQDRSRCGLPGPVGAFALAHAGTEPASWPAPLPAGATLCVLRGCEVRLARDASLLPGDVMIYEHPIESPAPTGAHGASGVVRPRCDNGLDDDGDGLVDRGDPGCRRADHDDETDPRVAPACDNGLDDDGDGAIDFPDDIHCDGAGDDDEQGPCASGEPLGAPIGSPGAVRALDLSGRAPLTDAGPCLARASDSSAVVTLDRSPLEGFVELALDRPARLVAYTRNSSGDPTLSLRRSCGVEIDRALCDADGGPGVEARLEVPRLEAGRHALFVRMLPADGLWSVLWRYAAGGIGTTTLVVELDPLDPADE